MQQRSVLDQRYGGLGGVKVLRCMGNLVEDIPVRSPEILHSMQAGCTTDQLRLAQTDTVLLVGPCFSATPSAIPSASLIQSSLSQ